MTLVDAESTERLAPAVWRPLLARVAPPAAGIALSLALWWLAGALAEGNPRFAAFDGFTIGRTFTAFGQLVMSGDAWRAAAPSLSRVLQGLGWAFVIGAPVGLAIGSFAFLDRMAQLPFQVLRMVSPLAWMPIAVLAFARWDGAIVFLITAAAVWPIVFATAASVKRVDPLWLAMARNLGGSRLSVLAAVIIPALILLVVAVAW